MDDRGGLNHRESKGCDDFDVLMDRCIERRKQGRHHHDGASVQLHRNLC